MFKKVDSIIICGDEESDEEEKVCEILKLADCLTPTGKVQPGSCSIMAESLEELIEIVKGMPDDEDKVE